MRFLLATFMAVVASMKAYEVIRLGWLNWEYCCYLNYCRWAGKNQRKTFVLLFFKAFYLVRERLPKQSVTVRCGFPMVGFGSVRKLKQSVAVTTKVGYFCRFSVTYFSVKIALFWLGGALSLHIFSTNFLLTFFYFKIC